MKKLYIGAPNNNKENLTEYNQLIEKISQKFVQGRGQALSLVNQVLVETNWNIGRYIVEYEQQGNQKAVYGAKLLETLSKDLVLLHGRGFSLSNLKRMRQIYLTYPIGAKASHQLSWSHYVELLKIDDKLERSFYEKQTVLENWSVPQLIRQKKSSLYLRLAASRDKKSILKLAKQGQNIEKPTDIIREPYILNFFQIPNFDSLTESDLEKHIISKIQNFLLELGKGFAFIDRQYRIML
jgi:predicted nuclease of restriction endonuclease-like (RecB) superfamily